MIRMKRMLSLILIAFLTVPFISYASSNDPLGRVRPKEELSLYVNGHFVKNDSDIKYFIKQNRTFIHLRSLEEELGYNVDYDQKTKDITIRSKDNKKTVLFHLNKDTISAGNVTIKMDVKPILLKDRTFVPIRFFVEVLGEKIEWENESKSVFIGERLKEHEIEKMIAILKKTWPQENKSVMNDYTIVRIHEEKNYIYKDVDVEMIDRDSQEKTAYQLAIGLSKSDMQTIKIFVRDFFTTGEQLTLLGE